MIFADLNWFPVTHSGHNKAFKYHFLCISNVMGEAGSTQEKIIARQSGSLILCKNIITCPLVSCLHMLSSKLGWFPVIYPGLSSKSSCAIHSNFLCHSIYHIFSFLATYFHSYFLLVAYFKPHIGDMFVLLIALSFIALYLALSR